ncbi:MAG TPA: hypothetical protein VHB21_04365, partial [Minicystis sp.]|nr:hypothetical protein [Minicystis sp.]
VKSTNAGDVDFVLWNDGGSGVWGSFAQLGADVSYTGPLMAGGGGTIDLTFQGALSPTTRHYFYARRDASWGITAEPVAFSGNDSFGWDAAAVTRLGADTVIAYAGDNHDLYDQTRTTSGWLQASGHSLGNNGIGVAPALVALGAGGAADLMIVFVRSDTSPANQVQFTKRTPGNPPSWSAPIAIDANAYSNAPPAAATLANGDVVVVFLGQDQKGYFSRWTGTPTRAWTVPAALSAGTLASPPAVAPGVGSADAEIAFVDATSGAVFHARLAGTTLATPALVGGAALSHVAIASE